MSKLKSIELKIKYTFFFKQLSCYGSNVKNELKVKQLAKQPPTLKMLMQKNWSLTVPVLCISQSCIEM